MLIVNSVRNVTKFLYTASNCYFVNCLSLFKTKKVLSKLHPVIKLFMSNHNTKWRLEQEKLHPKCPADMETQSSLKLH